MPNTFYTLLKVLNALEINKSERSFVTSHYLMHTTPTSMSHSLNCSYYIWQCSIASLCMVYGPYYTVLVRDDDFYGNEPNDAVMNGES